MCAYLLYTTNPGSFKQAGRDGAGEERLIGFPKELRSPKQETLILLSMLHGFDRGTSELKSCAWSSRANIILDRLPNPGILDVLKLLGKNRPYNPLPS